MSWQEPTLQGRGQTRPEWWGQPVEGGWVAVALEESPIDGGDAAAGFGDWDKVRLCWCTGAARPRPARATLGAASLLGHFLECSHRADPGECQLD